MSQVLNSFIKTCLLQNPVSLDRFWLTGKYVDEVGNWAWHGRCNST